DWQVNHQLQNVSMEQATERSHFSQEAQVWKQSLRQTQQELAWVQEELQQAWQEAHRSQQELARQDVELVRVSGALNATQKELQDVQGKLNAIQKACLFISTMKKSWWESYRDCMGKSSHLLIQDEWEMWMLPVSMGAAHSWSQHSWPPGMGQTLHIWLFCFAERAQWQAAGWGHHQIYHPVTSHLLLQF
uniref:Uncharacterized protein n=1 Tax=Meleagris gallopavo TaxID=9103 RepID=A0A803YLY9_MELGA